MSTIICELCGQPWTEVGKRGKPKWCRPCNSKHEKDYWQTKMSDPVFRSRYWFKENLRRKGFSVEEFAWLLHKQNFICANAGCSRAIDLDSKAGFALDHNHACCPSVHSMCGKCFRGILCQGCNTALGGLGENKERIIGLLSYLETHSIKET